MSIEQNLRLALHQLVEAIEYTPMGVRGIKAMANARKALEAAQQPATCEPSLIEKAISSGWFGVLPVKATIPMCKAGWGASGGGLTFQQIGHIYEEMYKARPLPDASIDAAKESK